MVSVNIGDGAQAVRVYQHQPTETFRPPVGSEAAVQLTLGQ